MRKIILATVLTIGLIACNNQEPKQQLGELSLDSLQELSSNIPFANYVDLKFLNDNTGFALAHHFIAKTTDGGVNWTIINLPLSDNLYARKMQLIDSQTYYVIAGDNSNGYLLKTVDGGQNWITLNLNTYECPNDLFFIDNNVGFVVGKGLFRKTIDGGNNWINLKREDIFMYVGINFKNQQEGVVTLFNGEYLKTNDVGNTWTKYKCGTTDHHLYDVYFVENKTYVNDFGGLLDLDNGNQIAEIFGNYLYINAKQCVATSTHYEELGYFPYNDICITNDNWATNTQKIIGTAYSNLRAPIAKMGNDKVMMIFTNLEEMKIYILKTKN